MLPVCTLVFYFFLFLPTIIGSINVFVWSLGSSSYTSEYFYIGIWCCLVLIHPHYLFPKTNSCHHFCIIFQYEKFNPTVYGCSWYYWNKKNKKAFLTILCKTIQPVRFGCYGMVYLDYTLITAVSIYSFIFSLGIKT